MLKFTLRSLTPLVFIAMGAASMLSLAAAHISAAPAARVVKPVDDSKRTVLYGHVSSALVKAADLGRLDPSTPAQHVAMVLKSSDEQRHELRRVLDQQQDGRAENYHQWLTPEEFGSHFGVDDGDIAKVAAWLKSHGLTVDDVSKSKRVLHFSGTTGQLEAAFQTEMHSYRVGVETHVAASKEISVPEALSPVIAGVTTNNFFRKSHMGQVRRWSDLERDRTANPLYTSSSGAHSVGPWDFAEIYNTLPLLNAGINGSGSSIAVAGRSDILLSDVQSYRTLFGLPNNDPVFIHAGQDNGIDPGDDGESDLDVEIAGGIAPNAKVYLVIGTPTFLVDGISNSIQYIVENNLADILSVSYGSCESEEGTGGNEFNNQAFEQAAAQGISVFVSTGDSGAAGCDNQKDSYEVYGYAAGAEASTPYNIAVGGSEFYETANSSSYWSSTGQQYPYWGLSALGYLPEVAWNDAYDADKSASATANLGGLWAGSGGISSYYVQPSWQRGSGVFSTDPGLTYGGDWVTNVTLTTAGSGYTTAPTVTFSGGGCVNEPMATTTIFGGAVTAVNFEYFNSQGTEEKGQGFGCTSAPTVTFSAAPSGGTTATGTATIGPMWNALPLVSGVPHRYTPDVVVNSSIEHDPTVFCSEGNCEFTQSGSTATLIDAGLTGGTSVGAPSMAGIQALVNQANGGRQGAPNYVYYALSAAQSESGCNSTLGSGVGSSCVFHDITAGDNLVCGSSTCSASNTTDKMGWAAGTGYDLATGLGSVNAYNLATQWSTVAFSSSDITLSLSQTGSTNAIPQGTAVTFSGTVAAGSGSGTPTGDVAFILSQGDFGETINLSSGAWNSQGSFATLNGGSYSATLSNLPAGSYTITARYGGDSNFASSVSTPVAVTVAAGNSAVAITPQYLYDTTSCSAVNQSTYTYGQLAWIPVSVTSTTGAGVPTGTATITVDGGAWGVETLDPNGYGYLAAGAVYTNSCLYDYIFSQGPLLTGGAHTIGASYSGDSTFSAATATPVTVTVNKLSVTPTLAATGQTITSGFAEQLTATFGSAITSGSPTTASGPTGTVTFTDTTTGTALGTAAATPVVTYTALGSGTTTFPSYGYSATASLSTTGITTSGAHAIKASYSGDSNYAATTSSATTVTVDATTPAATTTTVTSSSNPTTIGGTPTFTATVALTGSGTAPTSGTVTFLDKTYGTVLGTATVGSASTAALKVPAATEFYGGAHSIAAVFGGTTADGPSISGAFTETVTKGTGTINLAARTSGTAGQTYTFAAVLTPSISNAVYPPNLSAVQFYDGGTLIGSAQPATINAAQGGAGLWTATLADSNLAAGTHTITATYSDANFSFSTSNAVTVTVGGAPTITWVPAALTYGTALGASQLDATASVAGTFAYSPAAGATFTAGAHTLSVTFTPTNTVEYPVMTKTVQLTVNPAAPTISWAAPSAITYGAALSGSQLDATASVAGTLVYSPTTGTVLTAGSQTLSVTFTPTDSVDYSSVTTTVQLTVNQVTPTVAWSTPAAISYGTALSATQLNATGSVAGTFAYSPAAGTVLTAGAQTLSATFTPTDSVDYSSVTKTVQLTVNPATPTVAWSTPAAISYGTALSATQLNATGSVAGTFAYSPAAGTVLTAGSQTLSVTFTPSDAVDYVGATKTIQLLVNPATPMIGWSTPSAISYGTALSAAQLNATASVAGTLVYSPAAGAVLTAGSQTLSVTFTPSDAVDYVGATKTIQLVVNPATPTVTWSTPAAIGYGTALSAAQLNAVSSTPGSFQYSPSAGTVLTAGSQTLSATFTPSDAVDYVGATKTIQLLVNQAGLTVAASNASGVYGQPLPALTYAVAGFVNGDTVATATSGAPLESTSATSVSTPGVYPIAISKGSLTSPNYAFTSFLNGSLTLAQAASTITLASLDPAIYADQSTTLTATVSVAGSGAAPSQTVTFLSGTTVLGTGTLSAIGATSSTATLTLSGSQLALGANAITAVYGGDANYAASTSTAASVSLVAARASFGQINVGAKAAVQTLTYDFSVATTLSAVNILTAGAPGLDYVDGGQTTCSAGATYSAGQSCAVSVVFAPTAPGPRPGAVALFAQGSTLPVQTWYLKGTGESSAATIDPGTVTALGSLSANGQAFGSVVDGLGNVYVVDQVNSQVVKLTAPGFAPSVVVGSGLLNPTALAVDGAGNLYISDSGNNRVVVVPNEQGTLNAADLSVETISGLGSPRGIAVDASGNLYVADSTHGDIVEVPAGGGSPSTVASGLSSVLGLAVDGGGNVYATSGQQVLEYPAGGGSAVAIGSGFSKPRAVAVDASGAIYVADSSASTVVVVAPGGASQTTLPTPGIAAPAGVSLDAAANVYVAAGGTVYQFNRTLAAPLSFVSVNVDSTGSAQTLTVSDAGNQPLAVSGMTVPANFTQVSSGGTDCSAGAQLTAAARCAVAMAFAPTVSGNLSGTLAIADNSLNNAQSAQSISLSGSATQVVQTISFATVPAPTYGVAPVSLTATATSGLPVSFAVVSGPATVSGRLLTITGAGTVVVGASQGGNVEYAAATSVMQSIVVGVASQTITFYETSQPVGATLTLTATASSGLPVSYVSNTSKVCTVSGSVATFLTSGTCTFYATQGGNANYAAAAPVTLSIIVAPYSQTITFAPIPNQTVGATLTATATASSGLPVTISVKTPGVCSLSGSTATMIAAGNCQLETQQTGNTVYAAAPNVSQTFLVQNPIAQTITFGAIPSQAPGTTLGLTATASSGLPVAYASTTPSVCSASGGIASFLAAGTCSIVASQAGNTTYLAAPSVTRSFGVAQASQTIAFSAISTQTAATTLALTATASSGLAVAYASSTPSQCSVSGSIATLAGYGTCVIAASQPGNTTYAAAASVTQSFTIVKASQTIAFSAIPAQSLAAPLALTATASSGLGVSYTSNTQTVCTISGATANFLALGTCTIVAYQPGSPAYLLAPTVTQSFAVQLAPQTITFNAIANQTFGTTLALTATSSSGLPVALSSNSQAICTVSGSTATMVAVGTCKIEARQNGNGVYAVAQSISQSFTVTPNQTITFNPIPTQIVGTPLKLTATASSGLAVAYASSTPTICTVSGGTASFVAAGTCAITASQAGNSTYSAATAVTQSFTVGTASKPNK